ncbi:hypothetical protein CPC16_007204 [Podila verticillata]|nr:hypothetical protein CPC16_007204 [Podila verticillata]
MLLDLNGQLSFFDKNNAPYEWKVGDELRHALYRYQLTMQNDGNLVMDISDEERGPLKEIAKKYYRFDVRALNDLLSTIEVPPGMK